jgi:hypothetical protein
MIALILFGVVVYIFFYFLIPVLKLKQSFPNYFAKDRAPCILRKTMHLLASHAI